MPRGVLDKDKALPVRMLILRKTRVLAVVNCHDDTFKPHTDAKAALLVLEKKKTESAKEDDCAIFMAISQGIGHNGVGEPIYKTDNKGDEIVVDGHQVLDHDADDILAAWEAIQKGKRTNADYYFQIPRGKLTDNLNLNLFGICRATPQHGKRRFCWVNKTGGPLNVSARSRRSMLARDLNVRMPRGA